ncbi:hypothetical protein ES705_17480 [subsurface metagenome]
MKSKRPLFTYTTSIEPQKTVGEIQEVLTSHGAKSILSDYDGEGKIKSLSFMVNTVHGDMAIQLPCNPEPVYKILKQQYREKIISAGFVNEHQALRVSWRIILYWVKAQMAILETEMVQIEQIFLPYMTMKDGRTLYEKMIDSKFQITDGD